MLTSKDLAELLAETPLRETSEFAKKITGRGFQEFSAANFIANYAKLLAHDPFTTSQTSHKSRHCESVAKPIKEPFLASSQTSRRDIADSITKSEPNDDADDFWQKLRARIAECDALIHRVCDLRGDPDEYRAELLAIRKRMAPAKLESDIAYLKAVIKRCEQLVKGSKP